MTVLSIQSGKKKICYWNCTYFILRFLRQLVAVLFFCFLTEHSLNDHNNLKGIFKTSHLMISALSLVNLCTFRAKITIIQGQEEKAIMILQPF